MTNPRLTIPQVSGLDLGAYCAGALRAAAARDAQGFAAAVGELSDVQKRALERAFKGLH